MNATARKPGGVLHSAKLLQGQLVRLAERRDRQIARATGEFEIDLVFAIGEQPLAIARMVLQAISLDQSQAFLQRALGDALAQQSEQLRAKRAAAETEPAPPPDDVDASFAETFRLPPPAQLPSPPVLPTFAPMSFDGAEPEPEPEPDDDISHLEQRIAEHGARFAATPPGGHRYPEPGEPAMMLPDGTVVAADGGA